MEAGRVNAVALSGRSWTIVEDVPQMAATATAPYLDPVHAMTEILKRVDDRWVNIVE